jgi:ComF family protein
LQADWQQSYTESCIPAFTFRRVVFSSSGDLTRVSSPSRAAERAQGVGIQQAFRAAAESLFAVLFPSDCRICHSALTKISPLPVCQTCLQQVAPLTGILCNICGEKLFSKYVVTDEGPRCGICRRIAPPFQRAVAFGAYDGVLRDLIHLLKYQRIHTVAPLLARLMDEALKVVPLPDELLVVPVPLFKRKLRDRGFNQAEKIARAFVNRRKSRSIQLETSSLARIRQTASQTGLTRHQRRANVRGAFAVTRPERIQGRSVLVVDDVMTTGTTVADCARVLLRAGARHVFVATLARATREVELHLQEQVARAASARA